MSIALRDGLRSRAIATGQTVLANYAVWYKGGTFNNSWGNQWIYTSSGPVSLCAAMYIATGQQKYLDIVMEAYDYVFDNLMTSTAEGDIFVDEQYAVVAIGGLERIVFGTALGQVLFTLLSKVDDTHRNRWIVALKRNAEVEEQTDANWYINGNWMANKVRMLWYLQEILRLTGDAEFQHYNDLYEKYITFLTSPATVPVPGFPTGNPLWTGYGLVIDTAGGWPDKSDEFSHLVELAGGPPMPNAGAGTSWNGVPPFGTYDGDYTGLTLEHLTDWYVRSRDFRALRLLNGSLNKYFATVDTTTWVGNFSGGSRHNNPNNGIYTPALAVLTLLGERQSNVALRVGDVNPFTDAKCFAQWDVMINGVLTGSSGIGNIPYGICRSLGNVIPSVLYACDQYVQRL